MGNGEFREKIKKKVELMDEYISFLKHINWFCSCNIESENYMVLDSLFDDMITGI